MEANDITKIDSGFAKEVASASGVDLFACYQCGKCTNGCPVTFAMDYHPQQIIRMVQLGLTEEIAHARSMWVCSSCETCFTRCPNEIDIPKLMDHLKHWVLSQGARPAEGTVAAFHQVFIDAIRRFGRVNETFLMGIYQLKAAQAEQKLNPKEMLKNLKLGIQMLKRGRLTFVPRKTGGTKAVRKLFVKKI
jgi:heterodisulfide reductase subunit C